MAITRVLYIVFPVLARNLFLTKKRSLVPAVVPVCFGLLYALPSLHPCCHRFYKFGSYAMSYVGYTLHYTPHHPRSNFFYHVQKKSRWFDIAELFL